MAFFTKTLSHQRPPWLREGNACTSSGDMLNNSQLRYQSVEVPNRTVCTGLDFQATIFAPEAGTRWTAGLPPYFGSQLAKACAYLVWFKVVFEFHLGQIEGKVPDESRVGGLGRERNVLTRRVSTAIATVYYVARNDVV